jgi:hypothetical protein
LCIPSRGGSVIITSGWPCWAIKSLNTTFISQHRTHNDFIAYRIPFASLIASGTLSTPLLFFAFF